MNFPHNTSSSPFGTSSIGERFFDEITISIANSDDIINWSRGEVTKAETINYRTLKPEHGGLFCARIFGPIKDYECLCGKLRRMKHKGEVCPKCNVEVTLSRVRRERMGHIKLQAPVAHIWFLRSLPSRIGLMMDMKLKHVESVLYFEKYIVTDPGMTQFRQGELLTEQDYEEAKDELGDSFEAYMGAEGLKRILQSMDLEKESASIKKQMDATKSETKRADYRKRLKTVESFIRSNSRPEWMILDVLPVLPPDLRPLVPMEGGRFATSDLNDLYRRVITRNNRLKRLEELRAPGIIVRNEKRMLQESVDSLIDNGRRGRMVSGANKRPLKSLSEMLKGKQGRFRQNLLGKRVDYSGRSVIVVGPNLQLHQCGIPKQMALELFRPFILSELERRHVAPTIKAAKRMIERRHPEVWDVLEKVTRGHPVLLNRAPTLHRLGIQAFEPLLVEGKAIQLHPLVCAAFNADFDGDQMAVHVLLSLEARMEARVLMMSSNNILSPANGDPVITASQDIVLGLYYLSLMHKKEGEEPKLLADMGEIMHALHHGVCSLHTPIRSRFVSVDEQGKPRSYLVETTAGRMMIGALLPRHPHIEYALVNKLLVKSEINTLIDTVYRHCGQARTVTLADQLMRLGFNEACRSGISFGKDDLIIPKEKARLIEATKKKVKDFEQQYHGGLITEGEKYNKVIDVWDRCTEKVTDYIMRDMSQQSEESVSPSAMNSVYMMAHSDARGSLTQMKQLAGMRGLLAKPSGDIIETPVISNFKEGLTVLEYFNSTHGARKGLADTALKTSTSGYLTRRLVDVAQDCIVKEEDCGTTQGITLKEVWQGDDLVESLGDRILGRCAAEDIVSPKDKKRVIVKRNDVIDEMALEKIQEHGIHEVKIRSVLLCDTHQGCCARCYGRDLARGNLVNLGEAVGVVAAQSIGEPGTQLTMRTFHIGGSAQGGASVIIAPFDGTARFENMDLAENSKGQYVVMSHNAVLILHGDGGDYKEYPLRYGSRLLVKEGNHVSKGAPLAESDREPPIMTDFDGSAHYHDIDEGVNMRIEVDEATGFGNKVIKAQSPKSMVRRVSPHAGYVRYHDIIDGINAQRKDQPVETEYTGYVRYEDIIEGETMTRETEDGSAKIISTKKDEKDKSPALRPRIIIYDKNGEDGKVLKSYNLSTGYILSVKEGQHVEKGHQLGRPSNYIGEKREIILSKDVKTECAGYVRYEDIIEGETMTRETENGPAKIVIKPALKPSITIYDKDGANGKVLEEHKLKTGHILSVKEGQRVEAGDPLRYSSRAIKTEYAGYVRHEDIIEGETIVRETENGPAKIVIKPALKPSITIYDKDGADGKVLEEHKLKTGHILSVKEGQRVEAGTLLGYSPSKGIKTEYAGYVRHKDIIEGKTMMMEDDGTARIVPYTKKDKKDTSPALKPRLTIYDKDGADGKILKSYTLRAGHILSVKDGQHVEEGRQLGYALSNEIKTKSTGYVRHKDIIEGETMTRETDDAPAKIDIKRALKPRITIYDKDGTDGNVLKSYPLKAGSILSVKEGQRVEAGTLLGYSLSNEIKTESAGYVRHKDIIEGETIMRETDDGPAKIVISTLRPRITICDKNGADGKVLKSYTLKAGYTLSVEEGKHVKEGDQLAYPSDMTPLITIHNEEGEELWRDRELIAIHNEEGEELWKDRELTVGTELVVDDQQEVKKGDTLWVKRSLGPSIIIWNKEGKPVDDVRGRYPLAVEMRVSVENGEKVKRGDPLATPPHKAAKTIDITGGLPRVADIFEARKPKDSACLAKVSGHVEIDVRGYKTKHRLYIIGEDGKRVEHLMSKDRVLMVQDNVFVERGAPLTDGTPWLNDILEVEGVEKMADRMVQEVQAIYRLQGVRINDKHIEVVTRQMMQKVEITDVGDSTFLENEEVDKTLFDKEKQALEASGKQPPQARPLLLGITKASLHTNSFISAASFQETTKVLTDAAIVGKTDRLEGLKENVIIGRLIPAGSGYHVHKLMREAAQHYKERKQATQQEDDIVTDTQGAEMSGDKTKTGAGTTVEEMVK